MSQEKVERYKKEKANRKKTLKKEKRVKFLCKLAGCLAGVAVVGAIGYSAYHSYINKPVEVTADMSAFDDYVTGISTEEE
ncbi:MAG: hypothetical protein IJA36_12755 [Lachnospiraceae bacterium]|nr:hypothetical protein [Lachnospiraceae bacterium]